MKDNRKTLKFAIYILIFIIILILIIPNYFYWNNVNQIVFFSDYLSGLILTPLLVVIFFANIYFTVKDNDNLFRLIIGSIVIMIVLFSMIPDGIVRSLEEENWKLEYKSKKLKITNILWTRTIEYQEIDKYDISIVKKFSNRGSDYWQMKVQITTKQNEDIRLYADFHESLFHFIKINQDRIIKLTKLKDELLNEYHNVASLNKI